MDVCSRGSPYRYRARWCSHWSPGAGSLIHSAGPSSAHIAAVSVGCFCFVIQYRPNGTDLAFNAVLFTVYLACCVHFWATHKDTTTGTLITIAGFFTWASVFVVAPVLEYLYPNQHIESEVWNLPKYVVAVGMILLQLEDQIEHNVHLALHDDSPVCPIAGYLKTG